jgi:phytoene dehydrogenase-like protein
MRDLRTADVAVVGGGIAGLTAAVLLARGGRRVTLLERSAAVGGRAVTTAESGFHLNLGPHAWYVGGPGTRVLEGLGLELRGNPPKPAATFALRGERLHTMPIGFVSLLTTDLLGLQGKFEVARILASLARMDTRALDGVTVNAWLSSIVDERARQVMAMLIRIAAYTDAPQILSAGAALYAVQTAMKQGVRYLQGGWQTILDQLQERAQALGVEIRTSTPVGDVLHDGRGVEGVRLDGGQVLQARDIVLATDPAAVRRLVADAAGMDVWTLVPSRAACLDVALERYPNPGVIATFGVDRPLYFSVHSASAALAPTGGAVVHAAKYLNPDVDTDPRDDEQELEALMDKLQPGWRAHVKIRRFLPRMTVTHGVPTARGGGFRSRPAVAAIGIRGLHLVGDWVGAEGTLANAAVASANRAAERILRDRQDAQKAVA